MNNKGFGLIELLISMVILLLILGAAYQTFTNLLTGFKGESKSIESLLDKATALELLRLDIEHAGYGIADDTTDNIITYDSAHKILTLRSTMNNTDKSTIGYALVDCTNGTFNIVKDERVDPDNPRLVFILPENKKFVANKNEETCPGNNFYLVFPYEDNACGCTTQKCSLIQYYLSTTQSLDKCNPNTFNLLRKVNNSSGMPILNCVADFQVRFELDLNGDGAVDTITTTLPTSNQDLRKELKTVRIYLLAQEGQKDPKFNFNANTTIDNVHLQLPSDYVHYRWKVIKLVVTPLNL
ncbi:MAG: prepilin-type N-terminal cleavage/methylation domain-containing protein [Desulfonauticus sp.]|nr:prepilin-type N-terminal cleavage/methylation domain-containing protein [Desulfonauticus sp.]